MNNLLKRNEAEAGEMPQQVSALAALPGDPVSIPAPI